MDYNNDEEEEDYRPTIEEPEFWDNFGKYAFIVGAVMVLIFYILDKLNWLPL